MDGSNFSTLTVGQLREILDKMPDEAPVLICDEAGVNVHAAKAEHCTHRALDGGESNIRSFYTEDHTESEDEVAELAIPTLVISIDYLLDGDVNDVGET